MPADSRIKYSEAIQSAAALTLNNNDIIAIAQEDSEQETGYVSKATRMAMIGSKIVKGIDYTTDLDTTSKTIVGAINELKRSGGSTDIISEASGAIATFNDGGDNIPMKSCEVAINNQSGISSVTISVCGQNYIDMSTIAMVDVSSDHTQRAGFAPVTLPAGTYKVVLVFSGTVRSIYVQNAVTFDAIANGNSDFTFTLTETTSVFVRTTFMTVETAIAAITNISMYDTSTITDTTVSLGQTVYEGSADVVNGTGISGGVPFTFTGANIPTLSGTNNIYTDCGDVEVEYFNENADQMADLDRAIDYHNYSKGEHIVGRWIDGRPIYEKTIDFGTLPNNTIKGVVAGIATNLDYVVAIEGIGLNSNNNTFINIPYSATTGGIVDIWYDRIGQYGLPNDCIVINTKYDFTTYSAFITIRYVKV